MSVERDKQKKLHDVAEAIFSILIRGGVENLSHTRVAEVSGVSRAWIYKYIGKSDDALVAFSLDAIGEQFAKVDGLLSRDSAAEVRRNLFQGTFNMLGTTAENPSLMSLYYRYAGTTNPIGVKVAQLEKKYLQAVRLQLEKYFKLSAPDARILAEVLHGVRMGLAHRYSILGLGEITNAEGVQKALRRLMRSFLIEDKKNKRRSASNTR